MSKTRSKKNKKRPASLNRDSKSPTRPFHSFIGPICLLNPQVEPDEAKTCKSHVLEPNKKKKEKPCMAVKSHHLSPVYVRRRGWVVGIRYDTVDISPETGRIVRERPRKCEKRRKNDKSEIFKLTAFVSGSFHRNVFSVSFSLSFCNVGGALFLGVN